MMKYSFEVYDYYDEYYNKNKKGANINIENNDIYGIWFSTEIRNLSDTYLEIIIPSLKMVLLGELEKYDFGYEIYLMECRKDVTQVIDTFNDWAIISQIPTTSIYELLRDWYKIKTENHIDDN